MKVLIAGGGVIGMLSALEFLDAGHEGLQHMAFASNELAVDLERLKGEGLSVIYSCDVVGRGALAYLATESHPGTMVELVEMTPGRQAVYQRVADAARSWNGVVVVVDS